MTEQRFNRIVELGGGMNAQFSKKKGNGINVDCRMVEGVDIVADFDTPLPLPSEEFDMVYSRYCIEHVSWRKIPQFLSEIHRILKWDGKAILVTANLLEQARVLVNKSHWDLNDLCMVFGDQDYSMNSHKSSMSPELAVELFKKAGFKGISILSVKDCITDMEITAYKNVEDARTHWVLSQLGEEEKILDVGCANGWCLRGHRRNIVYVDKNPWVLPNFVQADASLLDKVFGYKQFDVAVLAELLEHVDDPVVVLRSAWQVAKRLVITVPNEYEWSEDKCPFKDKYHVRYYTAEMLTQHLLEANLEGGQNFRIDKMTGGGWSWFLTVIPTQGLM